MATLGSPTLHIQITNLYYFAALQSEANSLRLKLREFKRKEEVVTARLNDLHQSRLLKEQADTNAMAKEDEVCGCATPQSPALILHFRSGRI